MSVKHTIRTKDGDQEVNLTARTAIKRHCEECLGFENTREPCTSPKCALYPFRTGHLKSDKVLTDDQRRIVSERLKLARIKR